jgi:hypothetical protein
MPALTGAFTSYKEKRSLLYFVYVTQGKGNINTGDGADFYLLFFVSIREI